MKKLIWKNRCFFAVAVSFVMVCFSACSNDSKIVEEKSVELPADGMAPKGILKGHFLVASQKISPEDFLENLTDESAFTTGFRNVRQIYEESMVLDILERNFKGLDITAENVNFDEIFDLTWNVENNCYEEQNCLAETLKKEFEPGNNGLYELEVAAADVYGNASIAKVYVLYDKAVTSLGEFEAYVEESTLKAEQESKQIAEEAEGFDRGKAEEAFAKVNEQRLVCGVQALTWDESLYELACIRAQEIVSNFSHQRPDGSYVGDVMLGQYGAVGCGENIASNYRSTTNLINGWLNSKGHKENMLDARFTAGVMACYCHKGSYYWINLFEQ